jgi:hypothetical protein
VPQVTQLQEQLDKVVAELAQERQQRQDTERQMNSLLAKLQALD